MTIEDIRVFPIDDARHPELLASASFSLDGVFAVHGVRLIRGSRRNFVAMPQATVKGERRDVAFPTNADFRERLTAALFAAYDAARSKA